MTTKKGQTSSNDETTVTGESVPPHDRSSSTKMNQTDIIESMIREETLKQLDSAWEAYHQLVGKPGVHSPPKSDPTIATTRKTNDVRDNKNKNFQRKHQTTGENYYPSLSSQSSHTTL